MTDTELTTVIQAAFKAFNALKPGEGIDISKTKTYAHDPKLMIDICKVHIDGCRAAGKDEFVMSEDYKIIKRF